MALLLGLLAGLYENQAVDKIISVAALAATSTPEFVIGVLLLLLFAVRWRLLPGSSALIGASTPLANPAKLVLLIATLALVDIGYVARMPRSSMIEVIWSSFIRAAQLRGTPIGRIVLRHALKPALVTPLIVVMLHINWLVGGIVVIETIYSYPGLGQLMLTAVKEETYRSSRPAHFSWHWSRSHRRSAPT